MIAIKIVAGDTVRPTGALAQRERQRLHSPDLRGREKIASAPAWFERPAVILEAEDLHLLAPGKDNANLHQIASDGFEKRCRCGRGICWVLAALTRWLRQVE